MLAQKILRCCASITNRRLISQSTKCFESQTSGTANKTTTSSTSSSSSDSIIGPRMHAPTNFDKWVLVWMKKFPKGQVPDRIREDLLIQTKSRARIKAANYMIAFTILGCIASVYFGKQAAKRGDTIVKRNQEWHRQVNEEHKLKTDS